MGLVLKNCTGLYIQGLDMTGPHVIDPRKDVVLQNLRNVHIYGATGPPPPSSLTRRKKKR